MPTPRSTLVTARKELGVQEVPLGSNSGAVINRRYKSLTWLNPNVPWPWCVAFWQYVIKATYGKQFPYRTAAVEQLEDYAREHKLTTTTPALGDAACFGGEHVTFVEKWIDGGQFVGLGGNQGNMVKRSTYSKGRVTTWVSSAKVGKFLGVAPPPPKPRPKFEIVRGEGGQKVVINTASTLGEATRKAQAKLRKIGHGAVTIRKNR